MRDYNYTPTRIAKLQAVTFSQMPLRNSGADEDIQKLVIYSTASGMSNGTATLENDWQIL